jgi:Cu(I)/Ag(I) efflux system membrane fusion protein
MTAQQNLIFLLKNDSTEKNLIEASKEKLRLLGMKDFEINSVVKSGKPKYQITVYSDYSGYIVNKNFSGDLNSGNDENDNTNTLELREGAYLEQSETVFKVVNNDLVWAVLKVYNTDFPYVKLNQPVEIYADDKAIPAFDGVINFIETLNTDDNKTVNVRVYISNPGNKFKIGQLVTADINAGMHKGIWVPKEAVLDLGKKKIVLVKIKNLFSAKIVTTGIRNDSWIEIKSGLKTTDVIASNAQYFLDSESFIKIIKNEK